MAIFYPDILEHNNSAKALADITQFRGTSYPIVALADTSSIPTDKRNTGALVFVSSTQDFYGFYGQTAGLVDWDTSSNWRAMATQTWVSTNYAPISHTHSYDNYQSWNLKTNGVQRTTVTSNGTLDLVAGSNVSLSYGAGGVVTISSTDTNTVYTHPAYTTRSITATGATVLSTFTSDAIGSVTGITTRTLTLADLGYTGATNANYITNNNQLTNGAGYATQTYVTTAVSNLVDTAPGTLDTLNELAAALGDDPNFATTVSTSIGTKLTKSSNLSDLPSISTARTNLGLGVLATLSTVDAATITDNSVGAAELNVTGNGTTAQFLRSDGDGTFTWATPTDTNTTYSVGNGGLTEINFTSALNTKLAGIATNANNYVLPFVDNSTNWNTAFGWGNHASAGYLTSYTDTNTTYTAGGGLTLTGTTFSLTDGSSVTSLTALTGADVVSDIDVDTYGRVTGLATRTMTLSNLGFTGAANANYITNTNQLTNGAGYITGVTNSTFTVNSNIYANRYVQNADGNPSSNLGAPTVTEMALFDAQFNNKTDFLDPAYLKFYTSTDGVNYTEYTSFTDTEKRKFVGGDADSNISIPNATPYFAIEILPTEYVYLNALYMYWSSQSHSSTVKIERKAADTGQWVTHTNSTVTVSSWPGHLYLPFSTIPFHPTSTNAGQNNAVRFIFQPNWSSHATYGTYPIQLFRFQVWGGYPAGKRNVYSTDYLRNVTFPATLTAVNINGELNGNSTTATRLQTARTIAGVSFNGSADISLNNNAITNGAGYTTNTGTTTGSGTNGYISKWSGATSQANSLIYDNGTNIGIGTTAPAVRLDYGNNVNQAFHLYTAATDYYGFNMTQYDSQGYSTNIFSGNGGYIKFRTASGTTTHSTRMVITPLGNVGIGTTSPGAKLEVAGTDTSGIRIKDGSVGQGLNIYQDNTTDISYLMNYYGGAMVFGVGNVEKLRIQNNGNVGIGTTTPAYKLTVSGGIEAGGKVTYTKSAGALSTVGYDVAGLLTSGNGQSAGFIFTCFGGNGYQKIVYSCLNVSGIWTSSKDIDEGVNALDVTVTPNGATITFTFKARTVNQNYTPRVTVEAFGSAINTTYA